MAKLTARQSEIYDFLVKTIHDRGYPPTRAEIAEELGFRSANAAEEHLKALARKGVIEIMQGRSRGIRIVNPYQGLPIIGHVAAGSPILAEEHVEDYCDVPMELFQPAADFLLEVHGLSMKDIGIMEGDLIAVHKTQEAKNGDVIVARVNDEVTVKRYQKKRNRVYLHPENQDFSVIEVNPKIEEFAIEGLYVGLIRKN